VTIREIDDLFYVCSLIEFVGRQVKNSNRDIVEKMGKKGLEQQLYEAEVNHCLSFEEIGDEVIEEFDLKEGSFDSVGSCEFRVPDYTAIGGVYRDLILDFKKESGGEIVDIMYDVFTSFISDEISNFNASTFYENPSYIYHSYVAGELLD